MTRRQILIFSLGLLACVAVAWALVALVSEHRPTRGSGSGAVLITAAAEIGGPFALTDQSGKRVTDKDFLGRHLLIYFGYTFCPDVCPTTLNTLSISLDMLGDRARMLVAAFVTIDPERDTAELLRAYIANFNPGILGLTGSPENIRTLAKAYRVYYARAAGTAEDDRDYLMEHSAGIYLIDPQGGIVRTFPHTASPEEIVEAVKAKLPAAPIS